MADQEPLTEPSPVSSPSPSPSPASVVSTVLEILAHRISTAGPSQYCQAFFLLSGAFVLSLQLIPKASQHYLLDYGPRTRASAAAGKDQKDTSSTADDDGHRTRHHAPAGPFDKFIRTLTSVGQTPHAWFTHFYLLSVAASAFWAWQFFNGGSVLTGLAEWEVEARNAQVQGLAQVPVQSSPGTDDQPPEVLSHEDSEGLGVGLDGEAGLETQAAAPLPFVSLEQVYLLWAMLALQGLRRLYESYFVMKPSKSQMWFAAWLLGLVYYGFNSVSVWIEGAGPILDAPTTLDLPSLITPKRVLGVTVFAYGWLQQHWCHKYLAGLKKYTLPDQGLFKNIVCAHYTCECLIYLGMAIAGAPPGRLLNRTVYSGLLFVAANLGTTASGTREWYKEKFGAKKLVGKWRMIPYVF